MNLNDENVYYNFRDMSGDIYLTELEIMDLKE